MYVIRLVLQWDQQSQRKTRRYC